MDRVVKILRHYGKRPKEDLLNEVFKEVEEGDAPSVEVSTGHKQGPIPH